MEKDIDTVLSYIKEHKSYFETGETRNIDFRMEQLKKMKKAIQENEGLILAALYEDLHKSEFEAYASEIGLLLDSIKHMIKNIKSWTSVKKVRTPITQLGGKSYIYSEPYGTVLIIGPFNYPFQLLMEPLIGAIAAGNCAVLKPSEYTPNVSKVISKIISENFNEKYIRVVEGGVETTSSLIHAPFDYVFFTGSAPVGKLVMEAASKNLTPITLELGGKSPCIIHSDADLKTAAKRIAWGKFLNAGQTCVAPDYVLVHKDVKNKFLDEMKYTLNNFYGEEPILSKDYPRIINSRHLERLIELLDERKIVVGGKYNKEELYMQPTIMDSVNWNDKIMEDEIFGPILPIIEYEDLDRVIKNINSRPKPLALYIFTKNKNIENEIIARVPFGGGCVNDTISHLATPYLPFGGVGASGIGGYHGKHSFDTFSHKKSILKKTTKWSMNFIYPPYDKRKLSLLKKFLK